MCVLAQAQSWPCGLKAVELWVMPQSSALTQTDSRLSVRDPSLRAKTGNGLFMGNNSWNLLLSSAAAKINHI